MRLKNFPVGNAASAETKFNAILTSMIDEPPENLLAPEPKLTNEVLLDKVPTLKQNLLEMLSVIPAFQKAKAEAKEGDKSIVFELGDWSYEVYDQALDAGWMIEKVIDRERSSDGMTGIYKLATKSDKTDNGGFVRRQQVIPSIGYENNQNESSENTQTTMDRIEGLLAELKTFAPAEEIIADVPKSPTSGLRRALALKFNRFFPKKAA